MANGKADAKAMASNIKIIGTKNSNEHLTISPQRFKKDMGGSAFNHVKEM